MTAEFVVPSRGTGAAHGRTASTSTLDDGGRADDGVRGDHAMRADEGVRGDHGLREDDETEVAEAFDVHALAVGPVVGYPDADTAAEADRVVAVLRRLGGDAVPPLPPDPAQRLLMSLTEADEALAHWAGKRKGKPGRPSALLWFGHGVTGNTGPALLVPDAGRKKRDARVTPDLFAYHVHAEQQSRDTEEGHWAMVVIEACNSKDFAADVYAKFLGSGKPELCSLLLVATGRSAAQGFLGAFRAALESYLAGKSWQDKVFTLRDLQGHLKGAVAWAELVGAETSRELPLRLPDRVPLAGAVTVAELSKRQREFEEEPTARADYAEAADETGFLELVPDFTGRTADLTAVADWCADADAPPVLVVTGPPGMGKSALLGEALRRYREGAAGAASAGVRVGAVLRLTGSTVADVVGQLTQALGGDSADTGDAPDPRWSPDGATEARPDHDPLAPLRDRLAAATAQVGGVPTLILADALDEAREPFHVASVLRELTETAGVRLLIGTRTRPYGDQEPGGRVDLRAVLGSATGQARVLELAADPDAAAAYTERGVRRVLREHPVGDDAWQATVVRTVRDAVEGHVREGYWQFLQAALAVHEIEQRPRVLAPDSAARSALEQLLASDRTGLFRSAVARITDGLPAADPLLRALALSQGRGLPRADGIWAHAAAGVAGSDRPPADEELSLFLSRAAAYVLLDGEDRRSVYRLAHRTYTEHLEATSTPEQRRGMLGALLDLAAGQCAGGRSISPHLETRLAQYAADCGAPGWAELAARPAVLDRLPVAGLSAQALAPGRRDAGATPADLPIEVLGTVASAHLISRSGPADRAGLRQLGGLRAAGRLHPAGAGATWEVCWGRLRTMPPHLKLDGTDGEVSALTAHTSAPWLVTGALDGTVAVWEPWHAHHPALLLRGCARPVSALAAAGDETGDGGPGLLLAAHDDRTLELWDTAGECPTTAMTATTATTATTAEVVRVAAALPDGTGRFALGGEAGYLALVGPDGPCVRTAPALAGGDVVGLVPLTSAAGRQWLAVAHRSGELVLWDVSAAGPVQLTTLATRRTLSALAAVKDSEGAVRLATGAEEGPVEFWQVTESDGRALLMAATDRHARGAEQQDTEQRGAEQRDAEQRGAEQQGAEHVHAPVLAVLPGPEGDALVVGDGDGTVRVLGPDGGPAGPDAGGVPRARATVVLRGPDGGAVLATAAGRDPLVHLWLPGPAADAVGTTRWAHVTGVQRHMTADGTEVLVVRESGGGAPAGSAPPAVRVLRAADGEDLTDRTPHDSLPADDALRADGPGGDIAPSVVRAWHGGRVMGWEALETGQDGTLWASLGREGVVAVWRGGPSGSRELVHRVQLGARGLHLTVLSGGRTAVTTDDGIVVLAIEAVASGADDAGTEDTHA
ncbi:AAA family ATPase [Streptomyces sp. P9(2023)]|uniref:AAA family ATPase n=1 Tax=Streptomyces sp. P9(2023) TaxID=3064394 RepID=UPI0028F45D20|nr:AAA family ATPase [Streptomyces sp. P9(2023)]MDT9693409.1 AAA family ATPase [Streptomyces sp. P9(2023)]